MDARRQHRIIYQTKIRMRAPGREDSVIARVQNLSANGMFVTAADLPDAGTEVQCRLTLGGERRTLRGRVAWVRPASPATPLKSPGAGIEFIDLDQRDSELLTRLVDPADVRRRPVDVWFEGMTTPIRCQAVLVGDGIRLETRLPFMRLQSEVKVAFTEKTPPEVRDGVLDGISLEPSPEDGVPFLRIGVNVAPVESAQGTIESPGEGREPEQKTPLASTMVDAAALGTGPAGGSARMVPRADLDRTPTMALQAGSPVPFAVPPPPAAAVMPPAPVPSQTPQPTSGGGGARSFLVGLLLGVGLAAAGAWAWIHRLPTPPPVATAAITQPAPVAAPVAPAAPPVAAAPAAEPAVAAAETAETAGPEIEALPTGNEVVATDTEGMSLASDNGRITFTVALEGKAAGAKEIFYDDPPGIGVTLPRARPKGGFGTFAPGTGEVRVMSRRRPAGGSLVRFFYDGRSYQGKLVIDNDSLQLALAPK
jgi:hypothetical protein